MPPALGKLPPYILPPRKTTHAENYLLSTMLTISLNVKIYLLEFFAVCIYWSNHQNKRAYTVTSQNMRGRKTKLVPSEEIKVRPPKSCENSSNLMASKGASRGVMTSSETSRRSTKVSIKLDQEWSLEKTCEDKAD